MRRFFSRFLPLVGLVYLVMASLPMWTLWYEPGVLVVRDTVQGKAPAIEFWRHIKRPTMIEFNATVRNASDGSIDPAPVCEGHGTKEYQPVMGVLAGRDLEWWVLNDSCNNLPPGRYWVQTCWTALTPARALLPDFLKSSFGWLLPPKTICSPPAAEFGNGYTFQVLHPEGQ